MKNVIVRATCSVCESEYQLIVKEDDYWEWLNGKPIQMAFPYLSADEREILISGMCGECWEEVVIE